MKVLVFAPHEDDEILGCGGTIAKYIAEGAKVTVCIVSTLRSPFITDSVALKEHTLNIDQEVMECHKLMGIEDTRYLKFRELTLKDEPMDFLNNSILELVEEIEPNVVYIPHFGDMHKDHREVADSVMVAMRPKYKHKVTSVYAYEVLSETEWNIPHPSNAFIPNVYVDISDYLEKKLAAMNCYKKRLFDFPNARSLKAIEALARYRGSTMGVEAAEAFMLIREYRE